jgi:hypothetical protein
MVKFYSITSKKAVEVPASKISVRTTKNGRKQLVATVHGEKLYRFVSAVDAKKYQ